MRALLAVTAVFGLFSAFACSSTGSAGEEAVSGSDDFATPDAGVTKKKAKKDSGVEPAPTLDSEFFDPGVTDDDVFQHANPDPAYIDVEALRALLAEAVEQKSDSVIVAWGDTIVTELYFNGDPGPATVQSITKSVVDLAVGMLIDEGKIPSVDTPVSTYFPEWNTGQKAQVTLRHLLSMTSGMTDDVAGGVFTAPDPLAYSRARELELPLGEFAYSNTGTMLFAGIIATAAGTSADTYVNTHLFKPLGITDWTWQKDGAGNVQTPGGLFLSARDLLKLGRLMRDKGMWKGQSLVSATWVDESTAKSSGYECYALLWWLGRDNCSASEGLVGTPGPIEGFYADGWGGNYDVVVPSKNLVGVRMKDARSAPFEEVQKMAFENFTHALPKLVR